MPTLVDNARDIVTVAAQIARAQALEPITEVLEKAVATILAQGTDEHGTELYALTLELPVETYAEIEGYREGLERTIRERIEPIIRRYPATRIEEVIITPVLPSTPSAQASRTDALPEPADLPSFWTPGFFRLFISHTSQNKLSAHNLKSTLAKYPVAAFVAHDDIEPTKEWQAEIERALRTADALAAIITPEFIGSRWRVAYPLRFVQRVGHSSIQCPGT